MGNIAASEAVMTEETEKAAKTFEARPTATNEGSKMEDTPAVAGTKRALEADAETANQGDEKKVDIKES